MIETLKEQTISLRLVASEVIIMHHEEFETEIIKNGVVPEILSDIKNTFNYANNWIFEHLPQISELFISRELIQKEDIEVYKKFIDVRIYCQNK